MALNLNSSSDGNIAVLGEVRNPGRYTIGGPVSPFSALAMAGGGAYKTMWLSRHSVTNRHVIGLFLNTPIAVEAAENRNGIVRVGKGAGA